MIQNITIAQIVWFVAGLSTVAGFCGLCLKWFKNQTKETMAEQLAEMVQSIQSLQGWNERQQHDIDRSLEEKQLMFKGILACLKGLQEQGCNGPVAKAIVEFEEFLLQHAHNGVSSRG